jgi:hypothetical protein
MRKVLSVALMAAMLSLLGITRDAAATATTTLEWGACGGGAGGCAGVGTNTLTLAPGGGQTLRLDIFLTHDEPTGLYGHVFSLNFDTDLGNELNLTPGMGPVEWAGSDINPGPLSEIYGPLTLNSTVESTGASAGRINNFNSVGFAFLPANGVAYTVGTFTATAPARYRVGQVFFNVNRLALSNDGPDVFSGAFNDSGAFNGGFDLTANGDSQVVTMNFGTASVGTIVIPEPGTVSLLGLGFVGLLLASRRRRG